MNNTIVHTDYMSSMLARFMGEPGMAGKFVEETDLRIDQPLKVSADSYIFELSNVNSSSLGLDYKLNSNYQFMLTHIFLGLSLVDADGVQQIVNFPDGTMFPSPQAEQLELIYQGRMDIKSGSSEVQSDLHNLNFRYSSGVPGAYGPDDRERGFYPNRIGLIFKGSDTNQFIVKLAPGVKTDIDANGAKLVLLLKGYMDTGKLVDTKGVCVAGARR